MVRYEWAIETVDEYGDVNDVDHDDRLVNLLAVCLGPTKHLVLIRDEGDEFEGLIDRQWAYVKPAKTLPTHFDGGAKVPQRFHKEVALWL
jgi:hypothetical protein